MALESTASLLSPQASVVYRTFGSLRHRNFRLLWIGSISTQAGFWMFGIAQGWLALQLTNSAFWLGVVGFASGIPLLLFSLAGGELADRFNRRNLMLLYQATSMAFITAFAVLVTLNWVELWHVVLVSFLFGTMMALNIPLRQSLLPELVGPEDLMNAVALQSVGFNSMRVAGPALAGLLIATIGMLGIFWLMVAGYLWALVMVFQMALPSRARVHAARHPVHNVIDGLRYMRRNTDIAVLMAGMIAATLLSMPYLQFLPIFARDILQVGEVGLGLMSSVIGVGALLASLAVASLRAVRRKGRHLVVGSAMFGGLVAAFAISPWYPLSIVLLGLSGIYWSVMHAFVSVLLQEATPDDYRGRVFSVFALLWGLQPLGSLVIGWLAEVAGAQLAVAFGGMASVLGLALLVARRRRLWEMD